MGKITAHFINWCTQLSPNSITCLRYFTDNTDGVRELPHSCASTSYNVQWRQSNNYYVDLCSVHQHLQPRDSYLSMHSAMLWKSCWNAWEFLARILSTVEVNAWGFFLTFSYSSSRCQIIKISVPLTLFYKFTINQLKSGYFKF